MKYTVTGTARGATLTTTIEAIDENTAIEIAARRGIVTKFVEPMVRQDLPASPLIQPPTAPIAKTMNTPEYGGLKALGQFLGAVAIALYFGCAACAMAGAAGGAAVLENQPVAELPPSELFALAIGFLLSGLFYHALSGALLALRDIARNSFK